MEQIQCDEKCQAKEEGAEELRHICQYCTKNKNAVEPKRDYSTAIREGGY